MKVKDIVEAIYGLMFYPDWKVTNKFRLYKNYKVEMYHQKNYISFDRIILMKKSKVIMSKSYAIDGERNITLCDNVTHILFTNENASMCLAVDDDVSVTVSRTDIIENYN